jgi:hypothetical protein
MGSRMVLFLWPNFAVGPPLANCSPFHQNAQKIEREAFNRAVSPQRAQDFLNSPEYRKLNEDIKKRANTPQPYRVPGDRTK